MTARRALSGLESSVLSTVEGSREAAIRWLADAVRIPSITGAEGLITDFTVNGLRDAGLSVSVKPVGENLIKKYPAFAQECGLGERPNVFGLWRAASPTRPPLVLNGHVDVVPEGDPATWDHGPFSGDRDAGVVWGRGAADMKGGITAALFAIRALRAAGVELACDVQLQCVIAEETGGLGTLSAIDTEERPGAVIVLEPTECRVAPACGGIVVFSIAVRGRRSHTAVSWNGVSAMEKLWVVYGALAGLAERRNAELRHPLFDSLPARAPFGVGTFSAGDWIAMIPEHATMAGRLGLLPGETVAEVRDLMQDAIRRVCQGDDWLSSHPPEIRWPNEGFPAWETPLNHPLVDALSTATRILGGDDSPRGVTYGSDAGHFAAVGVPTAIYGPGSIEQGHIANEFISEDQLLLAAKTLALTIMRYGAADSN